MELSPIVNRPNLTAPRVSHAAHSATPLFKIMAIDQRRAVSMADPLSIGASVLAFIGLADRIIRTCKYCIEAIEDAPKDIHMMLGEATSLRAIIDSIGESSATSLVPNLHEQNGPIKSCHSCLASLEALLPPTMGQSQTGKRPNGSVCSYYYCHYSHNQDETVPFLCWIIGHVCRQINQIPPELKRLHDHGCEPTTTDLEEILGIAVNKLDVLYIVIDAVEESTPRKDLLLLIQTITVDKRFEKIRILATSRQYFDIEESLTQISTSISMSSPMVDADIRRFVHSRLRSSNRLKRWHERFDEIEQVLAAMAQGMFRWAERQIQAIERLRDQSKLQQLLSNLPKDLSETYVRTFEAIPEDDRAIVRCILIWIIGHSPGVSGIIARLSTQLRILRHVSRANSIEIRKSVLKQALAADPEGTNTDWIHDREAYCLTLGCALYMPDILADSDLQDLFLRYINPCAPHYSRFEAIQSKIVQGD
ncbi:hypothetical protein LZL87_002551 [Fusarium oxysporum]|nr:hypothetical protein LZL87_002551 [Fusarium oxysporum]